MLAAPGSSTSPLVRKLTLVAVACLAALAAAGGMARAAGPGSANPSFGQGGIATLPSDTRVFGEAFQSDGKLILVGQRGVKSGATLIVARLTGSGSLDGSFGGGVVAGPQINSSFGSGSIGHGVAVQRDGKIVVVGQATDTGGTGTFGMLIERFNSNGTLDSSFGSGGVAKALAAQFGDAYAVAIQPDGKIIAVGSVNSPSGGTLVGVARLNSNGSLDSSFGSGGTSVLNLGDDSVALAVALQSDGKIVITGSQAPGLQVPNALIARLTPSGALDTSFNGSGAYAHQYAIGAANSSFNGVAVQSNGDIVAAGAATNGNTGADAIVARFTKSGGIDTSFGNGGPNHASYQTSAVNTFVSGTTVPGGTGVALAPNGDILVGGTYSNAGLTNIRVWALKSNGALDGGFGSGGVASTAFGSSVMGEGNSLAIAPGGTIAVGGDTKQPSGVYSGVATSYLGFGKQPAGALKLSLSGVSGTQKTSNVVKRGLKVTVSCNEACSIKAAIVISASTAKRLHLGKRQLTIASASASLRAAGKKTITLRLNRKYTKSIGKQKTLAVKLSVSAKSGAKHVSTTRNIRFKR